MGPADLGRSDRPKADGRWDADYAGKQTATVPDDLGGRSIDARPSIAERFRDPRRRATAPRSFTGWTTQEVRDARPPIERFVAISKQRRPIPTRMGRSDHTKSRRRPRVSMRNAVMSLDSHTHRVHRPNVCEAVDDSSLALRGVAGRTAFAPAGRPRRRGSPAAASAQETDDDLAAALPLNRRHRNDRVARSHHNNRVDVGTLPGVDIAARNLSQRCGSRRRARSVACRARLTEAAHRPPGAAGSAVAFRSTRPWCGLTGHPPAPKPGAVAGESAPAAALAPRPGLRACAMERQLDARRCW